MQPATSSESLPASDTAGIKDQLKIGRNNKGRVATILGSSALVSACGGGGNGSTGSSISSLSEFKAGIQGTPPAPPPAPTPTPAPTPSPAPAPSPTPAPQQGNRDASLAEEAAAARFLLRAQFSATQGDIDAVRKEGAEAWLSRQMRQQNDQTATEYLTKNGYDVVDNNRFYTSERLLDELIWSQMLFGGNEVRKRIAFALSQFFVVSGNRLQLRWSSHGVAWFWDLLNEHAFGNFRELLEEVALSPAMGAFLDSLGSRADDPASGRRPDENFAREVMQLFTIGLEELHIDGSPKKNGGAGVETYTNDDVAGLARVFTGFNLDASNLPTFPNPDGSSRAIVHPDIVRRPMTSNPLNWERPQSQSEHSLLEKNFLGISIPAGTDATNSVRIALDHLFNHPNVGPFFGKQMIQKLVTSNPSPGYIGRVAQVFNNNGRGIRGDLAAVFKAVLLDPEAADPNGLNDFRFGRLREPAARITQFSRTFGLVRNDGQMIDRNLSSQSSIGQVPMRAPSVFNFYRPKYVMSNSVAAANSMLSPEFQMVNEISVTAYLETLPRLVAGTSNWLDGMVPTYLPEIKIAENSQALLDHLDQVLTAGQLRSSTREQILSAMNSINVTASDDESKLRRIHIAVILILASNDYLIQK